MSNTREYGHFINGKDGPVAGELLERRSPGHGGVVARFSLGTAKDVATAIQCARSVFEAGEWSFLPGAGKAAILNKLAALILDNLERLSVMEAEESGKPIRFARGEISYSAELCQYAAALAWQLQGDAYTQLGVDKFGYSIREPKGVVSIILPWNFPLVTLFQKLPFALAAGCTIVVKPSEFTSGTALEVAKLAIEAGLPAGVFNVVTGTGSIVGDALSKHPEVDMVSFTGSTAVGKQIARVGAETVKRVALELGGKAANIVFADADLDAALDGVLFGFVLNAGQECGCGSRLLIESKIADAFVAKLAERAKKVRVGLPLDEQADIGPLIHKAHMEKVLAYIEKGKKEGAKLVAGGSRLERDGLGQGCFVEPTIFTDVRPDNTIFLEEIFGPVLAVTTFETLEEAVSLANGTTYGLGNGVWSKDVDKAMHISRRLRCGTVFINTFLEVAPQMPLGGFKQSGIGRENGLDGLLEFTEIKSAILKIGERMPALPHTI
jgi:betaine-aldehyde dehydrogenase